MKGIAQNILVAIVISIIAISASAGIVTLSITGNFPKIPTPTTTTILQETGLPTTTTATPTTTTTLYFEETPGVYIDVLSVTDPTILVTNRGAHDITNFGCDASDGTTLNAPSTILSGQIKSISWTRGDSTYVLCIGNYLNIETHDKCEEGQSCWRASTIITTTTTTTSTTTTTTIPKIDITVRILDESTGEPIAGAVIYLDGSDVGISGTDGIKIIKDVLKGSHNLEARYEEQISARSINVYPNNNFEIEITAPIGILLTVKDTGTNKLVEGITVTLEDEDGNIKQTTPTTQKGTVLAKDVIPGRYKVGIHISVGVKEYPVYTDYVELSSTEEVIEVDMPEPDFSKSAYLFSIGYKYFNFIDETGKCKVKAINTGDIQSEYTVAVCLVYEIDETTGQPKPNPIGGDTIVFGPVAEHDETEYEESVEFDTHRGKEEDIVIIFYDTYDYISEKDWSKRLSISSSIIEEWTAEAKQFCSEDPERCAEIVGIVVGTAIKTATGS